MGKFMDISGYYQGVPNWDLVRADGVDTTVLKATQELFVDPHFKQNQKEARRTMSRVGYYHFFKSYVDPVLQAQHFMNTIGPLHSDEFVVLDAEERGVEPHVMVDRMTTWLHLVEQGTGRVPWIYASPSLADMYHFGDHFTRYPFWVAHYGVSKPRLPKGYTSYIAWQYTDKGKVNGVKSLVDLSKPSALFAIYDLVRVGFLGLAGYGLLEALRKFF